jgi:hypothetical protein
MIKTIAMAFVLSMALAAAGCSRLPVNQETMLDRNWGRSYEAQKFNQIADPYAWQNTEPVVGVDGKIGERNVRIYQEGTKKEPAAPQRAVIVETQ